MVRRDNARAGGRATKRDRRGPATPAPRHWGRKPPVEGTGTRLALSGLPANTRGCPALASGSVLPTCDLNGRRAAEPTDRRRAFTRVRPARIARSRQALVRGKIRCPEPGSASNEARLRTRGIGRTPIDHSTAPLSAHDRPLHNQPGLIPRRIRDRRMHVRIHIHPCWIVDVSRAFIVTASGGNAATLRIAP
jgi:hypothetical protein